LPQIFAFDASVAVAIYSKRMGKTDKTCLSHKKQSRHRLLALSHKNNFSSKNLLENFSSG